VTAMPRSLAETQRYFADSNQCRAFMTKKRWPNGIRCPQCGSARLYFTEARNEWECKTRHAKRKFTLKTGTVFEDSPLGFDKWLLVVWMIANRSHVSCLDVQRATGVTHVTAWFMRHRLSLAMQGHVESTGGDKRNLR
jgi:transposase-like protein